MLFLLELSKQALDKRSVKARVLHLSEMVRMTKLSYNKRDRLVKEIFSEIMAIRNKNQEGQDEYSLRLICYI